jgi:L-histidine Nalpha-methyltransferase
MSITQTAVHLSAADLRATLAEDARRGLTGTPKSLPPKYFYDARGSELFEMITRLPEYYPTRAEITILERNGAAIVGSAGFPDTLVELGSGSSVKTRLLLDNLRAAGQLRRYIPVDVSPTAVEQAIIGLGVDYPDVALSGIIADFETHLDRLAGGGRRLVAFLGSTIGNLRPAQRHQFYASLRAIVDSDDAFLLGTDLVKDEHRLVAAYDDAAGVTAEFNRNVLRVLNRTLSADFDPEQFRHVALWNADAEWIEMRLRAEQAMVVNLADLDLSVSFERGEEILTEISAKFRRATVAAELAAAGFELTHWWTDPAGDFALSLAFPR